MDNNGILHSESDSNVVWLFHSLIVIKLIIYV